jgi:hypothetical protein
MFAAGLVIIKEDMHILARAREGHGKLGSCTRPSRYALVLEGV